MQRPSSEGLALDLVLIAVTAILATGALDGCHRSDADASRLIDDRAVLARVPARTSSLDDRALRAAVDRDPADLAVAVAAARRYVGAARATSDPRYLGRARAVLARWWSAPAAPPAVLLLRATIRQSSHDFAGALADLDRLLSGSPDDAQAWLTRAVILTVVADYRAAAAACAQVERLVPGLVAVTCRAGVDGMTGAARSAYQQLDAALSRPEAQGSPDVRCWSLTLLAELAARLGDGPAAERHFRAALAEDARDGYLLAAYADFLLDAGRPTEVVALLSDHTGADGLLLRLAIAERTMGAGAAHRALLAERIAASRARGDRVHLREEARFALELADDPARALALAIENWAVQREIADARQVLAAARATGDAAAAAPVLAWRRDHRVEDPQLAALAAALEAAP